MTEAQYHRGPDDSGLEIFDAGIYSVGFGHRRLSILDLSPRGHQPMVLAETGDMIVFNGEIYEYRELREWLIERGHRFRTQSDTECIVHLYEESGAEGIARLRRRRKRNRQPGSGNPHPTGADGRETRPYATRERCAAVPGGSRRGGSRLPFRPAGRIWGA